MPEERLQKILARAGVGSRRANEKLIEAGRVTVNGRPVKLGDKADPEKDKILLDGKPVKFVQQFTYIALNKPWGVVSSSKSQSDHKTVLDLIPKDTRVFPVGRLDLESEGLMLLTDDGELANRLSHPRYGHEKEYRVLVARHPDNEQLEIWRRGVVLDDGDRTAPARVRFEKTHGKGAWLRVTMTEGRNRQIRRVANTLGLPVAKLIRVRIHTLRLGTLKPGQWRELSDDEIKSLKKK
jgi:23S rRNA pseudouridine2605 synthase